MFILTVILCTALFSSPLDHFTFSAFQKIVKFNNSCKMRKITILFIVAMILATTLGDKDKKASKENKKKLKHLQEIPLPYTTPYREEQPVLAYPYDPHKLAYPYAQQVPQYQHAQQVPSYGQVQPVPQYQHAQQVPPYGHFQQAPPYGHDYKKQMEHSQESDKNKKASKDVKKKMKHLQENYKKQESDKKKKPSKENKKQLKYFQETQQVPSYGQDYQYHQSYGQHQLNTYPLL
ncbi:uncharacterized protein LOC126843319 isoform X3 [Adelges cooleyi]|uniref:uncharacterized protein LOC126843319 isoform X3 n=1 Tax=Adelges cooleyi TaxID=133065 RepID=UPI0021808B6A|nr:uncharacterized protein LOC126843319 isoform X3 [Adelges cooleyi]